MTDVVEERQPVTGMVLERQPDDIMSDDLMRRTSRVSEELARSGKWDDARTPEAAFAKILIGRDLGLTAAQAMQGIYFVQGAVQLHYATLGTFVRSREGYDYRAGWIKEERTARIDTADGNDPVGVIIGETQDENVGHVFIVRFGGGDVDRFTDEEVANVETVRVFVWHDEESPLDDRPVVGAAIKFTVDGVQRGLSRYTIEDAQTAGLVKPDPKAAWNTSRRNMFLARSMANGIKWFVPEVTAGMPVYSPGEIPEKQSITAPVGNGSDEPRGIDLGPEVEEIIARAERLGHAGLSNRAAIEVATGDRAPSAVSKWKADATKVLDVMEKEQQKRPVAEPPEEVDLGSLPDADLDGHVDRLHEDVQGAQEPAAPKTEATPRPAEETPETRLHRDRLERLRGLTPKSPEQTEQLEEEIAMVEAKLRSLGVDQP